MDLNEPDRNETDLNLIGMNLKHKKAMLMRYEKYENGRPHQRCGLPPVVLFR